MAPPEFLDCFCCLHHHQRISCLTLPICFLQVCNHRTLNCAIFRSRTACDSSHLTFPFITSSVLLPNLPRAPWTFLFARQECPTIRLILAHRATPHHSSNNSSSSTRILLITDLRNLTNKCRTIITNNLPTAAVTPAKRTVSNILLRILTGMASPPLSLVTARLLHTTVTVNRRQDTASRRRLLEMRCMVEDSLA